jgi:hypothetical protein
MKKTTMKKTGRWLIALLAAAAAGIPATAQQPLQVGPLRAMPGQKASGHLRVPMPEGAVVEIPVGSEMASLTAWPPGAR